jgi:hypothetical protein
MRLVVPIADVRACACALALASGLLAALPCPADDCWTSLGRAGAQMLGSLSCASTSCHGRQSNAARGTSPRGSEYAVWLEHDPHARAARTIQSEKFEKILDGVVGNRDAEVRRETYLRCAACHDPQGYAAAPKGTRPVSYRAGFTCESCHGAAEHWLAAHYERDITREQLRELGLVDTKNLLARARQCASCHVGDAERDMNHDMIAAGHPPLRFELSAYHDLIPHKHWSDAERMDTPQFKTQLWAAGQVAAADATLALLESRAHRAATNGRADDIAATSGRAPWPEFAEYDCFACHQRLRPIKGSNQVPLIAAPGIPGWQPWNLALAEPLVGGEKLAALRKTLGESMFADPATTKLLAADARCELHQHPLARALSDENAGACDASELTLLVKGRVRPDQPWAASGQQLLALQAAYLAWRDQRRMLMPGVQLVSRAPQTRLPQVLDPRDEQMQQRLKQLNSALRFGSPDFEWPALDWQGLPPLADPPELADSAAVARELAALAEALHGRRADVP